MYKLMDIDWYSAPGIGRKAFHYRRFHEGIYINTSTVYCRNREDFLCLLFYWSTDSWKYTPVRDEYGYIPKGN